jgi:hypothetical protein
MTTIISPAIDIHSYYGTYCSMNPNSLVEIDQQIAELEKQLSALYGKRVAALQTEIKQAQAKMGAFGSSLSLPAEVPVAKALVPQPVKRKGRPGRKSQPAAPTLATTAEEATVKPVEDAPAAAPTKKAARKPRLSAKKRTRTPTAVVEQRIQDALKEAGSAGLSQIEVSKRTGLGYQTVVKKLKELPSVAKKGSLKEARFFLKS